jgi:hypothetical protein
MRRSRREPKNDGNRDRGTTRRAFARSLPRIMAGAERPGTYLNPLNRPVRIRMPGGLAGDAEV